MNWCSDKQDSKRVSFTIEDDKEMNKVENKLINNGKLNNDEIPASEPNWLLGREKKG